MQIPLCRAFRLGGYIVCHTCLSPEFFVAFVLCLLNVGFVFVLRGVNDPRLLVNSAHVYYILDVICVQVSR